ncbi:MAG: hypothetical protein HC772_05575 [Leptolyngbyaceae cyanobacterium CRU_2_3]|nr:hypothetical protein [Leptolyngbyaceae cyanobacterium CRU_2_3]
MNIKQLRKSLKTQWLTYYRENRSWLTKLGIWVNCEGRRRPSSSFILATLSTLEPQLIQMLPLIVDLSSNPDRIVVALGLNFNPDEELAAWAAIEPSSEGVKMLPASNLAQLPDRPDRLDAVEKRSPVSSSVNDLPKPSQPKPSQPKPQIPLGEPLPTPNHSPVSQPPVNPFADPLETLTQPTPNGQSVKTRQPVCNPLQSGHPLPSEERSPNHRPTMDTAELAPGQLPDRY